MPKYKPQISDGEQSFTATMLSLDEEDGVDIIAFAEIGEDDAPIHTLIIAIDDDEVTLEFNDQLNQRELDDCEALTLTDADFRVAFKAGKEPMSGRVVADGKEVEQVPLRSVRVDLSRLGPQLSELRQALSGILRG